MNPVHPAITILIVCHKSCSALSTEYVALFSLGSPLWLDDIVDRKKIAGGRQTVEVSAEKVERSRSREGLRISECYVASCCSAASVRRCSAILFSVRCNYTHKSRVLCNCLWRAVVDGAAWDQ